MTQSLVSASWLFEQLNNDNIRIVDASWHMPSSTRDGYNEFLDRAIPHARFFDIDAASDKDSPYAHMLPSPEQFAEALTELSIENHHHVIVYDTAGLFSAARLWWMLRHFGHEHTSVLDGGLPKWRGESYPTKHGSQPKPSSNQYKIENSAKNRFISKQCVKQAIEQKSHSIFDARSAARFSGTTPEPRAEVRSGHMRDAINIPYASLLNHDGTLKAKEALQELLPATDKSIITSCGSGITACILSLALTTLGRDSIVYDGSWAEWGASDDTEVVTS